MENVLITGANRGIGFELTKRFLKGGNHVIATCRNPEKAVELNAFTENRHLSIQRLDVTDGQSVGHLCKNLPESPLDILINNAGIMGSHEQSIETMDFDAWLQTFEVNTLGPFRLAAALKNNLKQSKRPRIISLSSQMGSLNRESKGYHAYRSSKAALNKVMQVMALEMKEDGIIVCPVHPGWVQTDMGGPHADITVEESAKGLFDLINSLTMEVTGKFLTFEGQEHPW